MWKRRRREFLLQLLDTHSSAYLPEADRLDRWDNTGKKEPIAQIPQEDLQRKKIQIDTEDSAFKQSQP